MKPLVSVIITSYNSKEKYLREAINSVLLQSYSELELIVVDDGSQNDVCSKVCESYSDSRLIYMRQFNKGLPAARNYGVSRCQGEYICFLDDDDRWKKGKLEVLTGVFEQLKDQDGKLALLFSDCNVISETGELIGKFGYRVQGDVYEKILGKNIIGPPSSVMIKKSVFDRLGGFNEEFRYAEDIELWYRLTREYHVQSVNETLIDYRYRDNSLSKNYREMGRYCEKALEDALENRERLVRYQAEKQIRAKFYKDFAYLFFSSSDPKMFRSYYFKAIMNRILDVFDLKLQIGFGVSLFGSRSMRQFNKFKNKDNAVPKSLTRVVEI